MTDKPATQQPPTETKKRNKVATTRLFDAVEDIVKEAELDPVSSIQDLYDAFEDAIVKAARGL